ncbi:MAG: SAM-dependent methyltransferase [Flavobacteriia bacterium]|nr:SAM-dependent methyltransferase [Flavobacteriia bacterium]
MSTEEIIKGKIYMLPSTLGGESVTDIIPADVISIATSIRFFAVEDVKMARRLLRKMDREFPIDESTFFILNKKTPTDELYKMLKPVLKGETMAVISDAGCPGIADPGAELVALAHEHEIEILPLVGPSSILLGLMGSGFSGQLFTFHGYLPKERKDRVKKMKDFEGDTRRTGATHIFMDTPFRNMNVLDDLLNELSDQTKLCIAHNLTIHNGSVKTYSIAEWREKAFDLEKNPTMFLIGTSQAKG